MTCIVGVQIPEGVVIGGDSAGLAGWVVTHRADPKVFANGPYIVGFTTSFRMGQLIRYAKLPKPRTEDGLDLAGDDLDRFMVTTFIDAIRTALKDGGYAQKDKDQEEAGTFLVGVSGRLYKVASDYQVGWSSDDYQACGCGTEIAYGALHATRSLDAAARVNAALEAAAHHSGGVSGPFTILMSEAQA